MDTRTATREEFRAHFALALSPRTIGNRLLSGRPRSRVPLARLPLTPLHRQARLLWCRERVNWRVVWHSVVFSDESKFFLFASDGRTRIRRRPGERHLPECICPLHTSPTSGFMVPISYNSRSDLMFLHDKSKQNPLHCIGC